MNDCIELNEPNDHTPPLIGLSQHVSDANLGTVEETGAYALIILAMLARDGWVPDDDGALAEIVGIAPRKFARMAPPSAPSSTRRMGD